MDSGLVLVIDNRGSKEFHSCRRFREFDGAGRYQREERTKISRLIFRYFYLKTAKFCSIYLNTCNFAYICCLEWFIINHKWQQWLIIYCLFKSIWIALRPLLRQEKVVCFF